MAVNTVKRWTPDGLDRYRCRPDRGCRADLLVVAFQGKPASGRTQNRRAPSGTGSSKSPLSRSSMRRRRSGSQRAGVARDAKVDCAVYRLPLTRRLAHAPRWMLLKSASEHRDLDGWTTLVPAVAVPSERAAYWREIETIVNAFPGGCIAVEAQAQVVGWYGRERIRDASVAETVDAIRDGLQALASLHERVDQEARAGGAKA